MLSNVYFPFLSWPERESFHDEDEPWKWSFTFLRCKYYDKVQYLVSLSSTLESVISVRTQNHCYWASESLFIVESCRLYSCSGRWSLTGSLREVPSAPPSPNRRRSCPRRWSPRESTSYLFKNANCVLGGLNTSLKCVSSALVCLSVTVCRVSDSGHRAASAQ